MILDTKTLVLLSAGVISLTLIAFVVYFFNLQNPNPELKRAEVKIGNTILNVEVANTVLEKARGLSGRDGLGENEGMLFAFGEPGVQVFWMKGMKFPLDMIWIRGGKIVGFSKNVINPQPQTSLTETKTVPSPDLIDTVIEVGSGTVDRLKLNIGDAVAVNPGR